MYIKLTGIDSNEVYLNTKKIVMITKNRDHKTVIFCDNDDEGVAVKEDISEVIAELANTEILQF